MSSLTTGIGVLALAAIGLAGWQVRQPPAFPQEVNLPADPVLVASLPGLQPLPARLAMEPQARPLALPTETAADGSTCGLQITARAVPPATIALTLEDACRPDAVYHLRHGGLELSLQADAAGRIQEALPAFSDPARMEIFTSDGSRLTVSVNVPDLQAYHRAAFVWNGAGPVAVHAEDHSGHIRPERPGGTSQVLLGDGGHLSVLGGAGLGARAQVYTHPRDVAGEGGVIRLSLVLGQTPDTCGQEFEARRIETQWDAALRQAELRLSFPACAAPDGDLVLQNMFEDLRIASR